MKGKVTIKGRTGIFKDWYEVFYNGKNVGSFHKSDNKWDVRLYGLPNLDEHGSYISKALARKVVKEALEKMESAEGKVTLLDEINKLSVIEDSEPYFSFSSGFGRSGLQNRKVEYINKAQVINLLKKYELDKFSDEGVYLEYTGE